MSCAYNGSTTTNTYGADGLRRSSTVNGVTTYYAYDGTTLIREMKRNAQTGALYNGATYLTGPRGPEYRRDDTATELDSQGRQVSKCRWYVYDGLGSVVGEVDPSGNLTSSPKYDVYGLVSSNTGTASSAMGFVGGLGHLSEASTGLIYMKARYYDPSLGRFSSEDKKGDGNNWFVYATDNPINILDVTGQGAEDTNKLYNDFWQNIGLGLMAAGWAMMGTGLAQYARGLLAIAMGNITEMSGQAIGGVGGASIAFVGLQEKVLVQKRYLAGWEVLCKAWQ